MALKVIGAGFGRTGTLSLKYALEHLGFNKCYHNTEILSYYPQHMETWMDARAGKDVDWDKLFKGYQASVDFPASLFYKELLAYYPEAKVILTYRDPDRWYESTFRTIYSQRLSVLLSQHSDTESWKSSVPKSNFVDYFIKYQDQLVWDGLFNGQFEDKAYAIEVFNKNIEDVKRNVSPGQLLVYQLKEGWGPLCNFLEVPTPLGKAIPHINTQENWTTYSINKPK